MNFPIGTIIAWKNTAIPAGWAVCDGSNDTAALVDRFVMGASVDGDIGTTGGASYHSHVTPNTGTRNSHNHGGSKSQAVGASNGPQGTVGTGATDAPASHGHGTVTAQNISYENAHSHTTPNTDNSSNFPAYKKRVYIQRIS